MGVIFILTEIILHKKFCREFLGSPAVSGYDITLLLQRAQIQFLVGELRSPMLHGVAKKEKVKHYVFYKSEERE